MYIKYWVALSISEIEVVKKSFVEEDIPVDNEFSVVCGQLTCSKRDFESSQTRDFWIGTILEFVTSVNKCLKLDFNSRTTWNYIHALISSCNLKILKIQNHCYLKMNNNHSEKLEKKKEYAASTEIYNREQIH